MEVKEAMRIFAFSLYCPGCGRKTTLEPAQGWACPRHCLPSGPREDRRGWWEEAACTVKALYGPSEDDDMGIQAVQVACRSLEGGS